jgi:predicted DNA-binding ribbon-helix-helix protein
MTRSALRGCLLKRSMMIAGRRTSVALEPAFWIVNWKALAARRQMTLPNLLATIDAIRHRAAPQASLASQARVFAHLNCTRRKGEAWPQAHAPHLTLPKRSHR